MLYPVAPHGAPDGYKPLKLNDIFEQPENALFAMVDIVVSAVTFSNAL